eukprot:CAMPEP_0169465726 /NCGR_PEP_ID=MMETSP1042-20121227/21378_1 /TAXON_ID=464988 /ORGANISM="Hemiselmis andersenii, Strain CCMP1180" /LENGTH=91 /DNA_ID=CAMNT_0009578711 /DNA_START=66 /DNA_END=341 /DNA_ORIENTATION=-
MTSIPAAFAIASTFMSLAKPIGSVSLSHAILSTLSSVQSFFSSPTGSPVTTCNPDPSARRDSSKSLSDSRRNRILLALGLQPTDAPPVMLE